MISQAQLNETQNQAVKNASELGLEFRALSPDELTKFGRSFERQFVWAFPEREIVELYIRHMSEILLGAIVAKEQMSATIDGELPFSGRIGGPLVIRAGWLGIGDDWEDIGSITTGSPQYWIHSGTTLMGGTSGNPVKIGENAVHVVIAIGNYHPSPKIESIQFEIDGKPRPVLVTKSWLLPNSLRIKELDNAFLFKKGTTVLSRVFASATHGATVTDIPYPLGVSYIKEPQLRIHDVVTLPGTTNNVILTT